MGSKRSGNPHGQQVCTDLSQGMNVSEYWYWLFEENERVHRWTDEEIRELVARAFPGRNPLPTHWVRCRCRTGRHIKGRAIKSHRYVRSNGRLVADSGYCNEHPGPCKPRKRKNKA